MSPGLARLSVPILAVLVFAGLAAWFGLRQAGWRDLLRLPDSLADRMAGVPALTVGSGPPPQPPASTPEASPAAEAPRPGDGGAREISRISPTDPVGDISKPSGPSFDVVRVEPSGESVIAGRAIPGATVEVMNGASPLAKVVVDQSGMFAIVPPPLTPGSYDLTLRATAPDGAQSRSAQNVAVLVSPDPRIAPLVTVQAPGQPSVVLSRPDGDGPRSAVASTPPTEVKIATVEAEGEGRLYVSGNAPPGATIRMYLNDSYVAPGAVSAEGRLAFSIEHGIGPGDYRVRLDEVDPATGAVRSRAEVPFTVPPPTPDTASATNRESDPAGGSRRAATVNGDRGGGAPPTPPNSPTRAANREAGTAGPHAGSATTPAMTGRPPSRATRDDPAGPAVTVASVETARIVRGDNLWSISKRVYGSGVRYTVIFGANQKQIRDPALIYPGQVFVVPRDGGRRGG